MKIEEFQKLDSEISNYSFKDGYKNINTILFLLSILGNLTAIFLSNFLLVKSFMPIIENKAIVLIISLVLLTGMELLKRDFFKKFSIQYLKDKSFTREVIPLSIISIVIIAFSFIASFKGAQEYSLKSKELETQKVEMIDTHQDSISNIYSGRIHEIELDIKTQKEKIESKDKEQTSIESSDRLSSQQRNRVKDLKNDKIEIKSNIFKLENDITNIKNERDSEIEKYENRITVDTDEKKTENKKNSFFFVVVSCIIELVILIGVYFNNYYRYKSYTDFKSQLESNPNYLKWSNYSKLLEIIYSEERTNGDKIPSGKLILDLCKVNGVRVNQKEINDFLKLSSSLGILKTSGSVRFIQKSQDSSYESLKSHLGIQ